MNYLNKRDRVALESLKKMLNDSDQLAKGFAVRPDFGQVLVGRAFRMADQFIVESKRYEKETRSSAIESSDRNQKPEDEADTGAV